MVGLMLWGTSQYVTRWVLGASPIGSLVPGWTLWRSTLVMSDRQCTVDPRSLSYCTISPCLSPHPSPSEIGTKA